MTLTSLVCFLHQQIKLLHQSVLVCDCRVVRHFVTDVTRTALKDRTEDYCARVQVGVEIVQFLADS